MTFFDMAGLIDTDRAAKGDGVTYDAQSIELLKFFEGRATAQIRGFLQRLGVGDKMNPIPLDVSAMAHVVSAQSVVYSTPADRRLAIGGEDLEDDHPAMVLFGEVCERSLYDATWEAIDELRNLFRQVCVVFTESDPHRSVQMRLFEPFNVRRHPDARAADTMDADAAVAFQVSAGQSETDTEGQLFELWINEGSGYRVHQVDGTGAMVGVQPYGDEGISPFGSVLPALMVYDEPPRGRAYLPINENRLSNAKGAGALMNDLVYLVKQEAHSTITVTTEDPRRVPDEVGPGKVWALPTDSIVGTVSTNPKLAESAAQLELLLRQWAVSEKLPKDTFKQNASVVTGQALKVQERPLAKRRKKQVALVARDESAAYRKLARVHNVFARQWGLGQLPESAEMRAVPGLVWQPVDPQEHQEVAFKDMSVGAESLIGYLMQSKGMNRRAAIRHWEQVQADRVTYPVELAQNPAAVVDGGPHAATGPGGATKVPGAFNPERGTATEGASVADSVRSLN